MRKANSLEKTLMLGKIEGKRRRGLQGWGYHRLSGHGYEKTPGDSEGQGSLACCSPRGHKESDMTERLSKAQLSAPPISIYDVKASARLKRHSATCHPPCFLPFTADFLEVHTLAGSPSVTFTFSSVHGSVASVPTTFLKLLSPNGQRVSCS